MKKIKSVFVKILFILTIFQFTIFVSASEASFWSDIISQGDNFVQIGANATQNDNTASDEDTKEIMDDIYSILFPLGVVATVMVGGFLGIKFMLASAEDKAKVKESMVPYVIGCIVIYGAFGIWKICIQIFSSLS
jgi:hypothetical protein